MRVEKLDLLTHTFTTESITKKLILKIISDRLN